MPNAYDPIVKATVWLGVFSCLSVSCLITSTLLWKNVNLYQNVLQNVSPLMFIPLYSAITCGYLSALSFCFMYCGIVLKKMKILKGLFWMCIILWISLLLSGICTAIISYKSSNYALQSSKVEVACEFNAKGNIVNFFVYGNQTKLVDVLERKNNNLKVEYGWKCKQLTLKSFNEFKMSLVWYFITLIVTEVISSCILLAALKILKVTLRKRTSYLPKLPTNVHIETEFNNLLPPESI